MLKRLAIVLAGLAALVAAYLGWSIATANQNVTITVDPSTRFQVMNGWEVTPRMWEQNKKENRYDGSWLAYRGAIIDSLVNVAGVDRVRLGISSGYEHPTNYWARFTSGQLSYTEWRKYRYEKFNDNADPNVINPAGFQFGELDYTVENVALPMQAALKARGERLFVNLCFVDFRPDAGHGDIEHALEPKEYAELVLAGFEHLRSKYGITPDALEIILEPENSEHWRGKQIGEAMVAAAARLKAAGFTPQFIAPSTTKAGNAQAYFKAMMGVPGVSSLVSTLSYHNYDWPSDGVRQGILHLANRHHVTTGMLEHVGGTSEELYRDLTQANASAWQQWSIAYINAPGAETSGGSLLVVDPARPAGRQVYLANKTRTLAQYFRNVRAGAVRIGARSDNASILPVAFVNPDGSHVAVVLSRNEGDIAIAGLPQGRYGVSFASQQSEPGDLPPAVIAAQGDLLRLRIPGAGVLAVHQAVDE